jgi:RNA polymerase sigma factor (sigma-70 family)
MIYFLHIFIIFNLYIFSIRLYVTSLYLNKSTFKLLNKIFKNPLFNRDKSEKILYKYFEKWAVNKAYEFKKFHKYKCSNIFIEDLIIASKIGLFKSVKKYNGKSSFTNYANIYIKSELLKILTSHFSLSTLSKSYRTKSKINMSNDDIILYKKLLNTKIIYSNDIWQLEKMHYNNNYNNNILNNINNNFKLEEIINIINSSLTPFLKRIFYLKYSIDFKPVRSNRHVAELMCCSEEYIRKSLIKISYIIKNTLLTN